LQGNIIDRQTTEERILRKAPAADMEIFNFASSAATPVAKSKTG
jgi:hypothetical protein